MPTYTFMNLESGIEYDETMPMSEYDEYMKNNNPYETMENLKYQYKDYYHDKYQHMDEYLSVVLIYHLEYSQEIVETYYTKI